MRRIIFRSNWPLSAAFFAAIFLFIPAGVVAQGVGASPAIKPVASPPPTPAKDQSGIVEFHGRISLRKNGDLIARRVMSVPVFIRGGDQILTGTDGRVVLELKDGSRIRLEPNSTFVLKEESPGRVDVLLSLGKLWAAAIHDTGRLFKVETPSAVASIRGTEFSVTALKSGGMVTEVYQGAVAVQALKGGLPAGQEAVVLAGQRIHVLHGVLSPVQTLMKAPGGGGSQNKQGASNNSTPAVSDKEQQLAAQNPAEGDQKIEQAFKDEKALEETDPDISQKVGEAQKKASVAQAAWSASREIDLQMQQGAAHSAEAEGATSPMASQASTHAMRTAYQQQFSQSYFEAQKALQKESVNAPAEVQDASKKGRDNGEAGRKVGTINPNAAGSPKVNLPPTQRSSTMINEGSIVASNSNSNSSSPGNSGSNSNSSSNNSSNSNGSSSNSNGNSSSHSNSGSNSNSSSNNSSSSNGSSSSSNNGSSSPGNSGSNSSSSNSNSGSSSPGNSGSNGNGNGNSSSHNNTPTPAPGCTLVCSGNSKHCTSVCP